MYTRFAWGALRRLSVGTKQGSELLQWFRRKERHSRVEGIDDNQFRRQSRNESRRCRRRSRRSLLFNVFAKAQPIKVHHFLCLGRLSRATYVFYSVFEGSAEQKPDLIFAFPKAHTSKVWYLQCFRCFRRLSRSKSGIYIVLEYLKCFRRLSRAKYGVYDVFGVHLGPRLLCLPSQADNLIFFIYIYICMHKSQNLFYRYIMTPLRPKTLNNEVWGLLSGGCSLGAHSLGGYSLQASDLERAMLSLAFIRLGYHNWGPKVGGLQCRAIRFGVRNTHSTGGLQLGAIVGGLQCRATRLERSVLSLALRKLCMPLQRERCPGKNPITDGWWT